MKLVDAELLEKVSKINKEINAIWLWYIKQFEYSDDLEFNLNEAMFLLDGIIYELENKKDDDD
jgi:hypothetical protein